MSPTPPADGPIEFHHVDVFTDHPFSGNGLIVMFCQTLSYSAGQLRTVTEEMRQFETIFVAATDQPHTVKARIFTAEEELPSPDTRSSERRPPCTSDSRPPTAAVDWQFVIHDRVVPVVTRRDAEYFTATMESRAGVVPLQHSGRFPHGAGSRAEPHPCRPAATAPPGSFDGPAVPHPAGHDRRSSTGKGRSCGPREPPHRHRREVCLRLDTEKREGRTWDNAGTVEDIATGSAAGPAAAYLHAHGLPAMRIRFRLPRASSSAAQARSRLPGMLMVTCGLADRFDP